MNIFHHSSPEESNTSGHPLKKGLFLRLMATLIVCLLILTGFIVFSHRETFRYAGSKQVLDAAAENGDSTDTSTMVYLRASVPEPEPTAPENSKNPYSSLSVPTYFTKIGNLYFLVDCYHDQIIYHDNLNDPLTEWNVMTDQINRGHTLASDGVVYLADDTENHRVLIFEEKDGIFVHTQTFSEIGNRPHYIIYHEATDTFYVWSSMNGEMYLFRRDPDDNRIYLTEIRSIASLHDTYVRSFTILNDDIYFVSGNSCILRADLATFEILESYPVPDSMSGMIQLTKIQDYYYITVSTDVMGNQDYATILRTQDLSGLIDGEYEDIYDKFDRGGTPYYITHIDDTFYLTEHRISGSLWCFQVEDNELVQIEYLY